MGVGKEKVEVEVEERGKRRCTGWGKRRYLVEERGGIWKWGEKEVRGDGDGERGGT